MKTVNITGKKKLRIPRTKQSLFPYDSSASTCAFLDDGSEFLQRIHDHTDLAHKHETCSDWSEPTSK